MSATTDFSLDGKLYLLFREGNKALYSYMPSVFAPLYHHFEKMTLSRRVRLILERLHKGGYTVFYLAVDGELVGHCVAAWGGRRLKCSDPQDIVLGPYFIDPKHRGHHYAETLVRWVLEKGGLTYRYAYDYINKTNIPSIRTTLACGFELCGELDIEGFFHTLVEREGGEYNIYRCTPPVKND